ncbi:MAG: hypothetical protein COS35_09460 [Zetaproteobacteria bacterium CG02_land_8_20_14_3_00_50_9]|nr:MAG: hypothetical protein COW62_10440 [Zetaproteobacteria bacterium CG17_big_fil_post_rev_8_21_14_2_50_50_13]PIV29915.1 MAG: hypothetical protein COS35_09460 [Zetaproteobacteria bacterium CG02_land_8_20_14_3_00_50_9]
MTSVENKSQADSEQSSARLKIVLFGDAMHCPNCDSVRQYRASRSSWMRLFPSSYLLQCKDCTARRLVLFGL